MKTTLRGIFLTSENPVTTAKFYREVAGLELEQIGSPGEYVYWKTDRNDVQLAIHDAKLFSKYTHPVCLESNVTHLYFKITSHSEFLQHLAALEIAPFCIDEVVITVTDPDGRKAMFGTA